MNINISTTQWGDTKRSAIQSEMKSPISISRNLVMMLSTLTLVGLMVIQSIAPLTINRSASASDTAARSTEVVRSEELIPADEMSADEILRAELNKGEISGGGSMALP